MTRRPAAPPAPRRGPAADSPSAGREAEVLDAPLAWNAGDIIMGTYEVRGVLGKGGMGSVLRVHHRGWGLDLAVKSPLAEAVRTPRSGSCSWRKRRPGSSLGLHPHIACCYYVRTLGGIPRVFAECVEGGSLAGWIAAGRLTSSNSFSMSPSNSRGVWTMRMNVDSFIRTSSRRTY